MVRWQSQCQVHDQFPQPMCMQDAYAGIPGWAWILINSGTSQAPQDVLQMISATLPQRSEVDEEQLWAPSTETQPLFVLG
jgi:hypothetical protein